MSASAARRCTAPNGGSWRATWSGSERGFAPRRQTRVDRQGGSPAGSDRLRKPAGGPRPMDAGPARRRDGQADCAREPVARDGAAALSRRRSQAVAPEDVVHPAGRRRLRRPHGGRARSLAEAPDPQRPVVCFDESRIQLIGEVRRPIPPEPGQVERYDCEYRRDGTANLFVFLDANRPWRKVKVTARRTAIDFAVCMRELADLHYPKAERIGVVLDNLSTHSAGAFDQAFPAEQARRSFAASSSTTFPSTPAGSTWSRSRSASSPANAWTVASKAIRASPPKSPLGRSSAMAPKPASTGVHNRKGPHQNGASLSEAHKPKTAAKSQNLCAKACDRLTSALVQKWLGRREATSSLGLIGKMWRLTAGGRI